MSRSYRYDRDNEDSEDNSRGNFKSHPPIPVSTRVIDAVAKQEDIGSGDLKRILRYGLHTSSQHELYDIQEKVYRREFRRKGLSWEQPEREEIPEDALL